MHYFTTKTATCFLETKQHVVASFWLLVIHCEFDNMNGVTFVFVKMKKN